MSKRLSGRTEHENKTHDHTELTATDVGQTGSSFLKRAMDVYNRAPGSNDNKLLVVLKFWEMKGLTITTIENTYNFDFVVNDDCAPVVSDGKFVIQRR